MSWDCHDCCMAQALIEQKDEDIKELEAELEEVRGELESLIQFTRSEIRKLPAEYVHEKQHSSRALLGGGEK